MDSLRISKKVSFKSCLTPKPKHRSFYATISSAYYDGVSSRDWVNTILSCSVSCMFSSPLKLWHRYLTNLWLRRRRCRLSVWRHLGLSVLFRVQPCIEHCAFRRFQKKTETLNCCALRYLLGVMRRLDVEQKMDDWNRAEQGNYVWVHLGSHVFQKLDKYYEAMWL